MGKELGQKHNSPFVSACTDEKPGEIDGGAMDLLV